MTTGRAASLRASDGSPSDDRDWGPRVAVDAARTWSADLRHPVPSSTPSRGPRTGAGRGLHVPDDLEAEEVEVPATGGTRSPRGWTRSRRPPLTVDIVRPDGG